jgi:hypothetical protein
MVYITFSAKFNTSSGTLVSNKCTADQCHYYILGNMPSCSNTAALYDDARQNSKFLESL